ncbi:transmembrane protein 131 [Daktulosphaira vitifoliae]|uniref:transmembrane protein 131 n=1 Tax=Daktulosphaira vitifoliae TaxID=58002 RepID=UPI0021A9B10B|nr:transmembrane protein 131 [Daktulosphaira vitifoliae]XP_050520989.1 transmembrane protein 131 [Daktulosphaira vitifoliae]XP_050520991.1 transmembrane protein 131 [Daktulosphaira vitifoliae]
MILISFTPFVRSLTILLMHINIYLCPVLSVCSQTPPMSYHHDSVYIHPQPTNSIMKDIVHSDKEQILHDKTTIESDEVYYFTPINPQNNKSAIIGQRLDLTLFEHFLNSIREKHQGELDFYKISPLNNLVLPLRATFSVAISIFNPYPDVLQVIKVFGGGPSFHLSLPSGKMEDQRSVWDILPYQSKSVIRFTFSERSNKNHTSNIGLYLSNHEYINVPIKILMGSKPGLYSSEHIIDFGIASRNGLVTSKVLNLCNSAKSSIIVQHITSDNHFVTVNFPRELEVSPQSCTTSEVAHISYHWDYVGYSYGETHCGSLTVKSNKGSELFIPYCGRTLEGDLVYEKESLHFVMSKAIHSTSIIKTFSLLNNFSSTPVAISQIVMPKNTSQYFKIRDFSSVILKPGQNKTLFRVAYVNPNDSKMDIISYLEFKTNASDFKIPVMVYDGQLSQILPATNIITLPPIRISSPRHTYIVVANENPVAIMMKDWGTTYTPHVTLTLVEIGKFNISMRRNSADSWSRPMIREDQILAPVSLPVKHYAIFQLLVSTPNPDQNLTVKIWIQTQHQHYSIPLRVSVFDKNLQVLAEPLIFENCHPGAVCTAEVNVMSWLDRTLALTSVTSEFVSENIRFIPTRPSLIQPQMISLVGHIEWIPVHHKNSSNWVGLFNKAERVMWLSSFHLINSSETSYMDFSWFYQRMGRYYAEEDNRTLKHQFTLETGAETCQFSVHLHLKWPKFIQEPGENRQQTTFELPTIEVKGRPHYQRILIKNTFHTQNITMHLAMYPHPYWCNITEFIDLFEHEVNSLLISRDDWELVLNNTSSHRKKVVNFKNSIYVPHKKTMIFVIPPQKEIEVLVRFQPKKPGISTSILFLRNDVTILESILFKGMGAYPVLSFGSKKKLPPLIFDLESSPMIDLMCSKNKTFLPSETRIFLIKNPGKHAVKVTSMTINSVLCSGYGFRILDCRKFIILPNQTREISVEFTADFTLRSVMRQLEINTEEKIGSETTSRIFIYQLWGIVPSEWDLCKDKYTWQEFRRGDNWARPEWESSIGQIMLVAAGILMIIAWLVSLAAVHTIDKDFLSKNLGNPCVGIYGKKSFQIVLTQSTNLKKTEYKHSKHKESNDDKRPELIRDPTSLGISQSENSYVKPSDTTPIWSFMLRSSEPEQEQKIEKDRSRSHLLDNQHKEKTKKRYVNQVLIENENSNQKISNTSSWQITRNRSPALDTQNNKNSKVEDFKFEIENRRRADKLLKKQFGIKPVDSWRKHKKAMNAAKYFEEIPITEKINITQDSLKPILDPKIDSKALKSVSKSNKKTSAITLPMTKQINNPELPATSSLSTSEIVKKPIASVAPYQIVLPKQTIVPSIVNDRTSEKCILTKQKPLTLTNKIEKDNNITIRPIISKKSISEDDGFLAEYKYMKKKNKLDRKSSLQSTPNGKHKNVTVESSSNTSKTKTKEILQQNVEKKEFVSTINSKIEAQLVTEKKITVLKRRNDNNKHPDIVSTLINKHGPVGSGRDRKHEELMIKCNTNSDIIKNSKDNSGSLFTVFDNATKSLNCDNSNKKLTFSSNDTSYNLWTSFVWGPVSVQNNKNRGSKI